CTPLPVNLELFNSLQHHSSAPGKLKYLPQQIDKSTISDLQLQIPSSSMAFREMAPTRITELAEALSLL
ncbi:hypothetical protein HAX54_005408, partial [Datura stramonium]|nr:hypothetical protein [Datura stramonium]